MRILIVEEDPNDREALAALARELGHEVRAFEDLEGTLRFLRDAGADVVVADWASPGLAGLELCRRIRELNLARYVYVILAVETSDLDAIRQVMNSDVDDFIAKPYCLPELMSRVRAGQRVIKLEETLRERIMELKTVQRRLELSAMMGGREMQTSGPAAGGETRDLDAMKATETWQNLEQTCAQTYAQALMADKMTRAPIPPGALPGGLHISTILMSEVSHQIEIGLGVVVTPEAAARMSEKLFGDPSLSDPEAIQDLLRELMNMLQGGLKLGFEADGFNFIASLPNSMATREFKNFCRGFGGVRSVAFEGDGLTLYTVIGCHAKLNRPLPVSRLREGMILAQSVTAPGLSAPLAPGVRLNRAYLDKLQVLEGDPDLLVCDPGRPEGNENEGASGDA